MVKSEKVSWEAAYINPIDPTCDVNEIIYVNGENKRMYFWMFISNSVWPNSLRKF